MKKYRIRLLIAVIAFLIGVSAVFFGYQSVTIEETMPAFDKAKTWEKLKSFENQDLRKLNHDQWIKLFNDFYRLLDKQKYVGYGDAVIFTKFSNEFGVVRFVLVATDEEKAVEPYTGLKFQVFDEYGNHLNSQKFDANKCRWVNNKCSFIEDVNVRFSDNIGRLVIEVTYQPSRVKTFDRKQIYALVGDKIVMIQVERND